MFPWVDRKGPLRHQAQQASWAFQPKPPSYLTQPAGDSVNCLNRDSCFAEPVSTAVAMVSESACLLVSQAVGSVARVASVRGQRG